MKWHNIHMPVSDLQGGMYQFSSKWRIMHSLTSRTQANVPQTYRSVFNVLVIRSIFLKFLAMSYIFFRWYQWDASKSFTFISSHHTTSMSHHIWYTEKHWNVWKLNKPTNTYANENTSIFSYLCVCVFVCVCEWKCTCVYMRMCIDVWFSFRLINVLE